MTALTIAAFLLAADGFGLALLYRRRLGHMGLRLRAEAHRADVAEADYQRVLADAVQTSREADDHIDDLDERNARLTRQLEQAVRRGEKAATAAMTSLARQQDEFASSLYAWQQIATIALTLPTGQRALPAAPSMPELIPAGTHAYLEPGVLVPVDQPDPLLDGADPPGVNGTAPTRTRTRKKAGQ